MYDIPDLNDYISIEAPEKPGIVADESPEQLFTGIELLGLAHDDGEVLGTVMVGEDLHDPTEQRVMQIKLRTGHIVPLEDGELTAEAFCVRVDIVGFMKETLRRNMFGLETHPDLDEYDMGLNSEVMKGIQMYRAMSEMRGMLGLDDDELDE